jgi:uncharacterized protein YuzE
MMTTAYDPEADAMFVRFAPPAAKSVRTEEMAPGVLLDFDDSGRLIGIDVRERMAAQARAA